MKLTHEKIDRALRRAAEKVHEESRRTGVPIVYMRDGEIVREIPPAPGEKRAIRYAAADTPAPLLVREERDSAS